MQAGFAVLARQLAAHPQPQPFAVGMAHAKGVVDRLHLGVGELRRQFVKIDVVRMDECADFAEGQEIVLLRQAENVVHRMRPEYAAARQVPIPQSAAAAIERGIDAAAHGVVDDVGFARPRRLPVEGKAEDQHHKAGRGRQRHRQCGGRAPIGQRLFAALDDGEEAYRILQCPHGGEGGFAVGQRDLHGAGRGAERRQRLRRAKHVEDLTSQKLRLVRHGGDDGAVAVGDQDAPAGARRPDRQRLLQRFGGARQMHAVAQRAIEHRGEMIRQRLDGSGGVEHDLTAVFEHLHRGADADRHHEGDDENRNGAP